MKLYLMRHSLAVSPMDSNVSHDSLRPLTPAGEQRAQRVGQALKKIGITPQMIWCSPAVRTRRTAEIVAAQMGLDSKVHSEQVLRAGMSAENFLLELQQQPVADLLAIGHQPDMGELVARLLWGNPAAQLHLQEAAVVALDVPSLTSRDRTHLEFWLSPSLAEKIVG